MSKKIRMKTMPLPIKELPVVMGIMADIREHADRLRQLLQLSCDIEREVFQWFRVVITPAGTAHRVDMIPTRRFRNMLAAVKADGGDQVAVHRSTRTKGAQVSGRVVRSSVKHEKGA